ncbi:MAG: Potassium channel protein, partial [uncultured Rubrobacteraceae bacterium]
GSNSSCLGPHPFLLRLVAVAERPGVSGPLPPRCHDTRLRGLVLPAGRGVELAKFSLFQRYHAYHRGLRGFLALHDGRQDLHHVLHLHRDRHNPGFRQRGGGAFDGAARPNTRPARAPRQRRRFGARRSL